MMTLPVPSMQTFFSDTSLYYEGDMFASNITHARSEEQGSSDTSKFGKGVGLALVTGVTGIGNALVILSFVVDANLRTKSNYFLLNLAICDFFIGTFPFPFYMINFIMNGRWILGSRLCKMWLVVDYGLTQCSVCSIVLISYDRFLAVTKAVAYREQQHFIKSAVLKMVATWVLGFLAYGPLIIFWEYVVGYSIIPEGECEPEFLYSQYSKFWSSSIAVTYFFIPVICILFLNVYLQMNIRKRVKAKKKKAVKPKGTSNIRRGNTVIFTIPCVQQNKISKSMSSGPKRTKRHALTLKKVQVLANVLPIDSLNEICAPDPPSENKLKISNQITQNTLLATDIKIVKSLSILVGTFFLCWAPFTLLLVVQKICHPNCIPREWSDTVYLVTYLNSSLNPFIYPLCHPAFKKAFMKMFHILTCGFKCIKSDIHHVLPKIAKAEF